jgi:hypothetical protein
VQQLEAEAEKGAKKTRELKLAKAALQVRCKTHVPHPLANRDGAWPPIKPGCEGIPRFAFQLHIISFRAIKPNMRGIQGAVNGFWK